MPWHLAPRTRHASGTALPAPPTSATRPTLLALAAASLLAVIAATGIAPPAAAADLSGSSDYGSPYDDPRYAEIYRHPPPRRDAYRDDDTGEITPYRDADDDYDDTDAPPRRHAGRDRDQYLPPMRSERRYAEPRHERRRDVCVPRHQIRDRLQADGWRDFHDLTIDGDVAILSARRPSGRLFELEIHRCSGEIVDARPQGAQAYGRRRHPSRS